MPDSRLVRVAIPVPLRRRFDYRLPLELHAEPGMRVRVPFGRQQAVGLVLECPTSSDVPDSKLREISAVLDDAPLLGPVDLALIEWTARYYHHGIGEVQATALPVLLRQGKPPRVRSVLRWHVSAAGRDCDPDTLARSPRQQSLLQQLIAAESPLPAEAFAEHGSAWRGAMKALEDKGLAERGDSPCLQQLPVAADSLPALNAEQREAVEAVREGFGRFHPCLLEGVTGSGKTEVYLRLIAEVITLGKQALVLVPEIGLTPQLLARFRARLQTPIAVLHSALTDPERLCAWLAARSGDARVVIATRSGVFTPLPDLGLIVIDEEHDSSFKQEDGLRYSARDVAIMRAHQSRVPIVMGSATPALETLHNAQSGRYAHLPLTERAGNARPPDLRLIDVRQQPMAEGLSPALMHTVGEALANGGQAMLFINRRGYAPVVICHDCGWLADCPHCDAHMTWHADQQALRCHHCDAWGRLPPVCPDCGSPEFRPLGQGTERIEQALKQRFPTIPILRVDRDSTRRKGSLEATIEQVHEGQPCILVGTQMLAKGHHFPHVTLVGILDIDQGLFSTDFRAPERMAQLIVQVAGRAGRAEKPGRVLLQTHHPDHPLMQALVQHGYGAFARQTLAERVETLLPPYSHQAMFRAEADEAPPPLHFLQELASLALSLEDSELEVLGPIPAAMERRQGRYRAQLLLQHTERRSLHRAVDQLLQQISDLRIPRKLRWHLEIDPQSS